MITVFRLTPRVSVKRQPMPLDADAQKGVESNQPPNVTLDLLLNQGGEMDQIQRIDSDVTNMNTFSKSFIAIPWKFKYSLTCPVQNKK